MYVVWELFLYTYFHVHQILMGQSELGVPTGGFLSAQLMVIYAIAQEISITKPTRMKKHIKQCTLCERGLSGCLNGGFEFAPIYPIYVVFSAKCQLFGSF